jgi:flagellar biosynthesis protein FlhF
LVLSAASGCGPMRLAAERFAPAGVTSLLLTKLDEAATLGPAFAWLQRSGHRLSYLTHGQNVPDDIAVADSRRFVQRLLAGNRDVVGDTASFTGTRAGEMSQP